MYFGKNIRYLRKERNLNQTDIANGLNLQRHNLSNYELGKSNPDLKTLVLICQYFDLDVNTMLLLDVEKAGGIEAAKSISNITIENEPVADAPDIAEYEREIQVLKEQLIYQDKTINALTDTVDALKLALKKN